MKPSWEDPSILEAKDASEYTIGCGVIICRSGDSSRKSHPDVALDCTALIVPGYVSWKVATVTCDIILTAGRMPGRV